MKTGRVIGVILALAIHVGFLLFGGLIFGKNKKEVVVRTVDLVEEVAEAPAAEKPAITAPPAEPPPEARKNDEKPIDGAEIARALNDQTEASGAPALDAASLASIEAALSGGGAGQSGGFSDSVSFSSGGRIGGTGRAVASQESFEESFGVSDIDQRPRPLMQIVPNYPQELRGKKVDGSVTVIFVVDENGKVKAPKVEKSTHPAFDGPALEAVRQWRFEPAVRGGTRVECRMRVPVRFKC